jgi:hypothetical protein
MRFCQAHWEKMREAVRERGLEAYVASGEEEAARRTTTALLDPDNERAAFDPLLEAHWAIVNNLMQMTPLGLSLMMGDGCPLCEANTARHEALPNGCGQPDCPDPVTCAGSSFYDWMIARAADDMVEKAQRLFGVAE